MSYYQLPKNGLAPGYYQQLPAGTPLWQEAPVPGWGINPLRAGPPRVGVGAYATPVPCGACGDYDDNVPANSAVLPQYAPVGADAAAEQTTYGIVALGIAGGIIAGLAFGYLYFANRKPAAMRANPALTESEAVRRGSKEATLAQKAVRRGDERAARKHLRKAHEYIGSGGFYEKGPRSRAARVLNRIERAESDLEYEEAMRS